VTVTAVAKHASLKLNVRKVSDQLRENGAATIHPPLFPHRTDGGAKNAKPNFFRFSPGFRSNRFLRNRR